MRGHNGIARLNPMVCQIWKNYWQVVVASMNQKETTKSMGGVSRQTAVDPVLWGFCKHKENEKSSWKYSTWSWNFMPFLDFLQVVWDNGDLVHVLLVLLWTDWPTAWDFRSSRACWQFTRKWAGAQIFCEGLWGSEVQDDLNFNRETCLSLRFWFFDVP